LNKIANDVRMLASGPRPELRNNYPRKWAWSSIMPGKVNPTQCEALMVCASYGKWCCYYCWNARSLWIECFKPLMAANFLQSARLLGDACMSLTNIKARNWTKLQTNQRIGWQFIDVSNTLNTK
jgi:fumarate hydratase class II